GVGLVLEGVARATGAGAERAAALDHEVVDDAVEGQPVVEGLTGAAGVVLVLLGALGQTDEVVHGLGGVVGKQVDDDVTLVGLQGGLQVSHGAPLGRDVGKSCTPILSRARLRPGRGQRWLWWSLAPSGEMESS